MSTKKAASPKKSSSPSAESLMTRRVVACRPHTDLAHVARLMWENDCGIVPVVDGEDRVVGVVTDRDVCMSAQFSGRPLAELGAGECMAREVVTATPGEAATELAQRMGARGVRRLPVVDAEGRLQGLVALSDLLRALPTASPTARKALETALLAGLGALTAPRSPEVLAPVAPAPSKARAGTAVRKTTRSASRPTKTARKTGKRSRS